MNLLNKDFIEYYSDLASRKVAILLECENLPKGYLQKKVINNCEYYYLQYRDGKTVKTKYIKRLDLDMLKNQIQKRKALESEFKDIENKLNALDVFLSKDEMNILKIAASVGVVASKHPNITRISLFGSRANGSYHDNSDVDLIFESSGPISLLKQNTLRAELEDEIGFSVDLVHGPLTEDSFLEVDKEIEIYASSR